MTRDPRRVRLTLRAAAGVLAAVAVTHAVVQGVGALDTWQPCFALGYDSDACQYIQYEAPTPGWYVLGLAWFGEAALALVVLILAMIARTRGGLALLAFALVLASNLIIDYGFTPMFNGGYVSADSPPGHGLLGAALLLAAGILSALIAVAPTRRTAASDAEAVKPDGTATPAG